MSGGAIIGAAVGFILTRLMAVIRSTEILVSVNWVVGWHLHTQHIIRGGLKNETLFLSSDADEFVVSRLWGYPDA
jgi:hypothetical protein